MLRENTHKIYAFPSWEGEGGVLEYIHMGILTQHAASLQVGILTQHAASLQVGYLTQHAASLQKGEWMIIKIGCIV